MGSFYRLKQFWQASTAGPLPAEALDEITGTLQEAQVALFRRFGPSDQWHSWRVYDLLKAHGFDDPDLLTAALLHDIGKVCLPLRPWERAMIVAGEKLAPQRAARWGRGEAEGWKRPFVVRSRHAEWGAQMAAEAGSSLAAVALIRCHQEEKLSVEDDALEPLLRQLQWADDQS